jgi:hypothetical protein
MGASVFFEKTLDRLHDRTVCHESGVLGLHKPLPSTMLSLLSHTLAKNQPSAQRAVVAHASPGFCWTATSGDRVIPIRARKPVLLASIREFISISLFEYHLRRIPYALYYLESNGPEML